MDAAFYGNLSHFINHSCDPNLNIFNVYVNCLDPNMPQLCLFAKKEIKKGEQITFDYCQSTGNTNKGEYFSKILTVFYKYTLLKMIVKESSPLHLAELQTPVQRRRGMTLLPLQSAAVVLQTAGKFCFDFLEFSALLYFCNLYICVAPKIHELQ